MDDHTWLIIDRIGIAVGFALILLALVGELRGWWNDVGIIVGALGLAVGLVSAFDHTGRATLSIVRPLPGGQAQMLGRQDESLGKQDQMLGKQDQMLGKQDQMLGKQDQMLGKQDQMLGKQDESLGKQDQMLELQRASLSHQHAAMDRFDRLVQLQEDVYDLLDTRLPGPDGATG